MRNEKEEKNKRKRIASIFAVVFGVITVGLLYAFKIDYPEDKPVPLIELDFSGGGESGGSNSEAKSEETVEEESSSVAEPVKTQETESPVKKTTSTKKTTNTSSGKKTNNNALAGAGTFGNNNGSGNGNSDGNGDGEGFGKGPGVGDNIGDGSGRGIKYRPEANNPVDEEGTVVVEILIDRSGKVTSAKVLSNHSRTTTSNPSHYAEAKKTAMKYKFNSKSDASLYEKRTIGITFKLN